MTYTFFKSFPAEYSEKALIFFFEKAKVVIDQVALAKQGNNVLDSVCLSINPPLRPSICLSVDTLSKRQIPSGFE